MYDNAPGADVEHQARIEIVRLQAGPRSDGLRALLRYIELLETRDHEADVAQSRSQRIEDAAQHAIQYHRLGRGEDDCDGWDDWSATEMSARLSNLDQAMRS